MAAVERSFNYALPPSLYLDTDFIVCCLVRTQAYHVRCTQFVLRLLERDFTTLYLSSLSWMEIAHVVQREEFRTHLPLMTQRRFQLVRWQDQSVRQAYV